MNSSIYEVARTFQYDYIYIDAVFLLVWIIILLKNHKYSALLFGLTVAPILYLIDAGIWWHTGAGSHYQIGTFIREYWIGEIQLPHPLGNLFWQKFGTDFMMTISYALFTFPWLWIAFQDLRVSKIKSTIKYGVIWLGFWLLIPLFSRVLSIDDTIVTTVRHMHSQIWIWIALTLIGYGLISYIYHDRLEIPVKLFLVGIAGAIIMELPLMLFHIRPIGLSVLAFDSVFMLNQAIPFLYLLNEYLHNKKPSI